jgi:hypothetical protein
MIAPNVTSFGSFGTLIGTLGLVFLFFPTLHCLAAGFGKELIMSRPFGLPKTGGRVRGTPNKKTEDLARKLRRLGCDPIEGLAKIALDPETKTELRFRCFSELAQYIYPKRKAIEIKQSEHVPELIDEGLPVPAEFRDRVPRI